MLWLVQRIFYGPPSSLVAGKGSPDLLFHEGVALWPVVVLMFVMGVASPFWINAIDPTVTALVSVIQNTPAATTLTPVVAAKAISPASASVAAEKQ